MKIQLKRSSVLDGSTAKAPLDTQMEYGELAINYNASDPSIFIKDSTNNIVKLVGSGSPITDQFLRLDASNGPVTGALGINGLLTASSGVEVTGGDPSTLGTGIALNDSSQLKIKNVGSSLTINDSAATAFSFGSSAIVEGSSAATLALFNGFPFETTYTKDVITVNSRIGNNGLGPTTTASASCFSASVDVTANVSSAGALAGFKSALALGDQKGAGPVYNFYAEGTAPNYFTGITEHAAGVSVTGGSWQTVSEGISANADSSGNPVAGISLNSGGQKVATIGTTGASRFSITPTIDGDQNFKYGASIGAVFSGTANTEANGIRVQPTNENLTTANFKYVHVGSQGTPPTTIQNVYGVFVGSEIAYGTTSNSGFYSAINGTNNYSFYAAGNAPSYFAGSITAAGGITGASTITGTDANMTIQPKNSATSRNLTLKGNSNSGGGGGAVSIGASDRGRVNFYSGQSTGTYRFYQTGSSSIAGQFSFDDQTVNRTFSFPDKTGTVAMTSDISDVRLKKNISTASSKWDTIKGLRFVDFQYDNEKMGEEGTAPLSFGLIAQEVETLIPSAVESYPTDKNENWSESLKAELGDEYKMIDYRVVSTYAVAALKEALERIEALEAEVAALKS